MMRLGLRLRLLRQSSGVSLRVLSQQTGFSASFLSLVENDKASPSVASLERIAAAFGLSLAEFFAGAEELECQVVREGDRQVYTSEWSQTRVELLAQRSTGGALFPVALRMEPGARSGTKPRAALTEEFALVLEGSVTLVMHEREDELAAGDSLSLPVGVARLWENRSEQLALLLIVSHRSNPVQLGPAGESHLGDGPLAAEAERR
jgi:transcriptional regulator with XRE-family HTH domain